MTYPYSDDRMTYDYETHRYILTEKSVLEELGINLAERSKNEVARANLLKLASAQVYRFIHEHNVANDFQDYIIAKTESGRKIIKEAMQHQLTYLMMVGDLSRSADINKRALWFDDNAKQVLYRPIPEIATSVCYTGRFNCMLNFGGEW